MHGSGDNQPNVQNQKSSLIVWNTVSDSTHPSALSRLEGVLAFVSRHALLISTSKSSPKSRAGKEEIPLWTMNFLSLCCACWMHAVHNSMHMDIACSVVSLYCAWYV